MGYDRYLIVHSAPCLNGDLLTMKTRLKLLQKLGKAQVDPTKPNFVNPREIKSHHITNLYSSPPLVVRQQRIFEQSSELHPGVKNSC